MKHFMNYILIAVVVMILVSCSNDNNGGNDAIENKETNELDTEENIVATTVSITEILDKLEIDLVGVPTSYKNLPERYNEATEVGNPMDPDLEIVLSLQPDDVLSVTNLQGDLKEKWEEVGVPGTFLDFDSVDAMIDEIQSLGEKYKREEQAEKLITNLEDEINEIEQSVISDEKPKVLILMGIPGSYIIGTEHSYIGDLVVKLGGEIAVTGHDEDFIAANTEYLQQTDADIILRAAHGAPDEVVKMFEKEFAENDIWKHFKAVESDRVYDLEEELFGTTANLAVPEAMQELKQILYNE